MKKVLLFAGIAAFLMACNSKGPSTEATEAEEVSEASSASQAYTVSGAESSVVWKGSKVTGDSHAGTIAVNSGSFSIEDAAINAGNFELDMTTLANTDGMDEEMTGKLMGHIASPDFFDVANNAVAKFEITAGTPDSLTGNLTIKGISKSITVPYTFEITEAGASATSSFSIDRTQWDIKYGSASFFDDLKDKAINDAIEFTVTLAATK